jgi:hypothetical protein
MKVIINESDGSSKHPTFCRRCGKVVRRVVALSRRSLVVQCPNCQAFVYGAEVTSKCGCGATLIEVLGRHVLEGERIPNPELCTACELLTKQEEDVVAEGGAFYRCSECKRSGVMVVESGLRFRSMKGNEEYNIKDENGHYGQFGVVFDKCEQHGKIQDGLPENL